MSKNADVAGRLTESDVEEGSHDSRRVSEWSNSVDWGSSSPANAAQDLPTIVPVNRNVWSRKRFASVSLTPPAATSGIPFLDSQQQPAISQQDKAGTRQLVTLQQKAAAAFRKNRPMIIFSASLFALAVLLWFGIKAIYMDPGILTARFFAATVIVCFCVFLLPFVRILQGQVYEKLAEFASFFNPYIHKVLALVLMAAGTIHGSIWIGSTLTSCEGTWCPLVAGDSLVQASCIQTFCRDFDGTQAFNAFAHGGLPSFANAFGPALPSELARPQSAVRSFYIGFFCWSFFAIICLLAHPRVRRDHFELFYYTHHLFLLAIPVFFAHCWTLSPPSLPALLMVIPCGLAVLVYASDKVYSLLFRRYTSEMADCIMYSDGRILELRLRPVPAWPLLLRPSLWFSKQNSLITYKRFSFAPGELCISRLFF